MTSNRDESIHRKPAAPIQKTVRGKITACYPVDGEKGGSWIGMNNLGRISVLLNGAFGRHRRESSYRKSRGLVLLDCLFHEIPEEFQREYDFSGIEPFTLVSFETAKDVIHDFRWDGHAKSVTIFPMDQPRIWSSPVMYEKDIAALSEKRFFEFIESHSPLTSQKLLDFNLEEIYSEKIKRANEIAFPILMTLGVTSIETGIGSSGVPKATMKYIDLVAGTEQVHGLEL